MLPDQTLFLTQIVTLWAVLDPMSHLPMFIGATTGLDAAERRRAACLSVAFSFLILAAFGFAGQILLHAMGVSLLSFQIAGGIVLFLFALSMVLGEATHAVPQGAANADNRRAHVTSLAVYPLATPIIAGPGAMLTMVLLMDNNRFAPSEQVITAGALVVVLIGLLTIFLAAHPIERLIRQGGTQLLRRIMGLLLAALAVNLVLSAAANWLKLPPI
ncbi:MAG TPA: MarC family protein [Pseudolabrys sp.]|nr:MarC family protein [Pseudolabrys sp.]